MENEIQYTKGFNSGYVIAKYNPFLIKTLTASLAPSNSYLEGMILGRKEYELEIFKDQLKEIGDLRANSNVRSNEFGRE